MKHLVTATAIAVALAISVPALAQNAELLNAVEFYRVTGPHPAVPYPYPYLYPYYYPVAAEPNTYPLPYYPFAPLETIQGTGGYWKWESHAYHWHPNS